MRPPHLRGQTPEMLAALWPDLPIEGGAARRVVTRLVHCDGDDLDGVRGLSKALGAQILSRGRTTRLELVERAASRVDPFVKYLFRSEDGELFEAVRIPLEKPRFSVCLSSQAGCGLGCAFCETGRLGHRRDLEPWEIVEQFLSVRRDSPERPVTGAVFQGQGEPLLNYENVIRAIAVLRHPCGGRIGSDRITISTAGILPAIERYTDEGHPYRLMVSLTSAFSEKRAALMPAGRAHGVPELAAAMTRHARARRDRVSLSWVLISGFNTGPEEARELGRLFRGVPVRLSVIDVNDPSGRFAPPSDEERGRFLSALAAEGIAFRRRYSGGPDIHAACGLLASRRRAGPTP